MKRWIEVWHPNQLRPSLREITRASEADIGKMIKCLEYLEVPWAFGAGERLPDEGRETDVERS